MLRSSTVRPLSCVNHRWRHSAGLATVAEAAKAIVKTAATTATAKKPRAEGTIASVFASLSGEAPVALPERFAALKREIAHSEEIQQALQSSWIDLCGFWKSKADEIANAGSKIIPEVQFEEVQRGLSAASVREIKNKGVVIVRGVVAEEQALEWLESIKAYIRRNPGVKGFPEDNKAVYELYWSKAQIESRSHPSSLEVQRTLLSLFHKESTPKSAVSFAHPLTYADRLRIRQPGDSKFALGPHCDGGSVERWEDPLYRRSYAAILAGKWREHDAWDIASRPAANMNLYDGPGACGVFRALQGWTSLSHTGPGGGTLKVLPAIKETTAYALLRPFFAPISGPAGLSSQSYLDPNNWRLSLGTPDFPGSPLGRSQEFNDQTHPHLQLERTMIPLKAVRPGDQAWWHCDGIHAVESANNGPNPSSVMYIPAVPLTINNARYVKEQRSNFLSFTPPPDFPGGIGESGFAGRGSRDDILTEDGRQAMGLSPFNLVAAFREEMDLLKDSNAIFELD